MWGVIVGKARVMTVGADTEGQARAEAHRQLSRPGRYGILKQWKEAGEIVRARDVDYTCATCGEWAAESKAECAEAEAEGVWFCPDCKAIERIETFDYTDDRGAFGW